MTVIRVSRKPATSTGKLASLSLLVAGTTVSGVSGLSTAELQAIAGTEAKAHSSRKSSPSRLSDAAKAREQRMVHRTINFVASCGNKTVQNRMKMTAAALNGATQWQTSFNKFINDLPSETTAELYGIDAVAGEKIKNATWASVGQTFVQEFGSPKLFDKLPSGNHTAIKSLFQEMAAHAAAQRSTVEGNLPEAYHLSEGYLQLQSAIVDECSRFTAKQLAEESTFARSKFAKQTSSNVDYFMALSGRNHTVPKAQTRSISEKRWTRLARGIEKAYKAGLIKPKDMNDFCLEASRVQHTHQQQFNLFSALFAWNKVSASSINLSNPIVRENIAKQDLWGASADFHYPVVNQVVAGYTRAFMPEALQEMILSQMGSTSVTADNVIKKVSDNIEFAAAKNITFEDQAGKFSVEKLLTMPEPELTQFVKTNCAEKSVAEFVKDSKWTMLNPAKSADGIASYAETKNTDIRTLVSKLMGGLVASENSNLRFAA